MKKTIFLLILLSSCMKPLDRNISKQSIIFSKDISFNEFISKLKDYAKNSSYPNLDN